MFGTRLSATYHPDRYSGIPQTEKQQAEELMKKINAAYAMLKK
jgi:DnaJ-class molecular chaperone